MSKYRITFEDPPEHSQRGRHGAIQDFLGRLRQHPNRWAVLKRDAKWTGYYYLLAQKNDDLEVRVVKNPNTATSTVYFRYVPVEETSNK